jgi:hypothetical protein
MHFNTKYIFQGDSQKEIVGKMNYNFNQILFFGVGPDGHMGPRGATGIYGPAGYRGAKGATGIRANQWFKQPTQPLSSQSIPYDVWVDNSSGDGDIKTLGTTGSWNYSGYSFFNSAYFKSFPWILGPAGSTEKYAIGIKDTAISPSINLVINDGVLGASDSNPNKTKIVVSTSDQIVRPIMSFGKSGAISSGVPSFLWDSIGSSTGLIYRSTGSFNITSYLGLSIDSGLARTILFGNSSNISTSLFSIRGDGNFDLYANTTVGSGSIFKLTSQNLIASAASFSHLGPMKVATYQSGTYALNISPTTGSLAGGILNETNVSTTSAFSFDDLTGYPILSGKPYGPISTAKHAETIFGSTGGLTGGTAGPYSYHVKRAEIVTRVTETVLASVYPAGLGFQFTYSNVFDLTTSNYYNSNVIIIKPTSYTAPGSPSVYIRVPASASQNLPPVYDTFKTNIYRIMLDDTGQFLEKYIAGIIFTFTATGGLISNSFLTAVEIPGNRCKYIDLHYLSYANPNNSNPRLFYRTCTGIGGYVDLANSATVGVQTSSVTTGISTGISTGTVTTSGTGNTFISQDFSNIGTGSKILCNLFYNQGYLPKEIWEADEKFGKLMLRTNKEGLFGYLTWARPIVNLLTKYPQYTKYFYLFSKPWTEHMAYKMGVLPKDNKLGKVIHYFGNKFSLIVYKLITSKKREKKK